MLRQHFFGKCSISYREPNQSPICLIQILCLLLHWFILLFNFRENWWGEKRTLFTVRVLFLPFIQLYTYLKHIYFSDMVCFKICHPIQTELYIHRKFPCQYSDHIKSDYLYPPIKSVYHNPT